MQSIKYFIALVVLSLGISSCTTAVIDEGVTLNPITRTIKYNSEIQNITYNHCVTCHGGPAPSANLDLTNYQNVRASAENGTLLNRVKNSSDPMPPNGLLTTEQRQIIAKWAEDGFLEE